jgi:ribosomal protein S18 acetylase RimI-like enzyme
MKAEGASAGSRPSSVTIETIERGATRLDCFEVPWDAATFGFPVAEIRSMTIGDPTTADSVLAAFDDWCDRRRIQLVSCRLPSLSLRESMALESLGFRFVEMVYSPEFELEQVIEMPDRAISIAIADDSDRERIEAIAFDAFSTGRFLLDFRLPPEMSRRRYANWVRMSMAGDQQTVVKAVHGKEIVGFFIVEPQADRHVYWHLTAVAPAWQGKGFGLSLWRAMLLRHRAEGAGTVVTTISGHNTAALNLYSRLGFRLRDARATFHWLRPS